jgi:hypothetical protein
MVLTPPLQEESWREGKAIEDFIFPLDMNDILFTLALNPSIYKENVSNLISKMLVINELSYIDLGGVK